MLIQSKPNFWRGFFFSETSPHDLHIQMERVAVTDLPAEVLVGIFGYLTPWQLADARCVCKGT